MPNVKKRCKRHWKNDRIRAEAAASGVSLFPARYLLKRAHRGRCVRGSLCPGSGVISSPFSCLMMASWHLAETSPLAGMSQEANRHRPDTALGEKLLHTISGSPERRTRGGRNPTASPKGGTTPRPM